LDAFTEMLRSWQNFYFMVGGAAAALLGLMFVAVSLGINLVTDENRDSIKTFVNPSIFYFVSDLVLCGLMLIPDNSPNALALVLLLVGIIALKQVIPFAIRLIRAAIKHQDFDLQEWLFQIIFPVLSNLLLFMVALLFYINQWQMAFLGLWLVIILLLLSAISNTWSLVMWIVEVRRD
jgi:hypothetical protein